MYTTTLYVILHYITYTMQYNAQYSGRGAELLGGVGIYTIGAGRGREGRGRTGQGENGGGVRGVSGRKILLQAIVADVPI